MDKSGLTPRERKEMFPHEDNPEATINTLVLYHVQQEFIPKEEETVERERKLRYVRCLCQLLDVDEPGKEFTNIVLVMARHTFDPENSSPQHCLEGGVGEALCPELQTALQEWVLKHPDRHVNSIHGNFEANKEEYDRELLEQSKTHLLNHATIDGVESTFHNVAAHKIHIAGFFDHECSASDFSYFITPMLDSDHAAGVNRLHALSILVVQPLDYKQWTEMQTNGVKFESFEDYGVPIANLEWDKDALTVKLLQGTLCRAENYRYQVNKDPKNSYPSDVCMLEQINNGFLSTGQVVKHRSIGTGYGTERAGRDHDLAMLLHRSIVTAHGAGWGDVLDREHVLKHEFPSRYSNSMKNYWSLCPPENPFWCTGMVAGLGIMGKYGANQAADCLLYRGEGEEVEVLLIMRAGSKWWATPGGFLEGKECAAEACVREFCEEVLGEVTILNEEFWGTLKANHVQVLYRGYSPDIRNTLHAWVETTCFAIRATKELLKNIPEVSTNTKEVTAMTWVKLSEFEEWTKTHPMYAGHGMFIEKLVSSFERKKQYQEDQERRNKEDQERLKKAKEEEKSSRMRGEEREPRGRPQFRDVSHVPRNQRVGKDVLPEMRTMVSTINGRNEDYEEEEEGYRRYGHQIDPNQFSSEEEDDESNLRNLRSQNEEDERGQEYPNQPSGEEEELQSSSDEGEKKLMSSSEDEETEMGQMHQGRNLNDGKPAHWQELYFGKYEKVPQGGRLGKSGSQGVQGGSTKKPGSRGRPGSREMGREDSEEEE